MRFYLKRCFAVAAIFLFAAVVWASTRTDTTGYDVTQTMKIGNTRLNPGSYTLKANESQDQLRVLHDGKLVATVPCHWVKLNHKANDSEILSNKNRVTRVEFKGRQRSADAPAVNHRQSRAGKPPFSQAAAYSRREPRRPQRPIGPREIGCPAAES